MRYGSVCSGIEAASVAWKPLGWKPAFFSEIEAAPRSVLRHHYPDTPLHGDFTTIKAGYYDPIDLLVGGTPCQSFSIAGLRGGLGDERGNLALEYLRLADRLRPRWLVWENVPGVLSSNGGKDFGSILGALGELGYGFAYRVLDAQYFGVPQRRRRVFVIGYSGDWRPAAAVLFERHSLQGHLAPRREAGQGVACDVAPSLVSSGRGVERIGETRGQDPVIAVQTNSGDVSYCLTASAQQSLDAETETLIAVAHALRGEGFDASEDGTGRGTPLVPVTIAFSAKDHGADATADCSPTLRSGGHSGSHANGGVMPAVAYAIQERAVSENPSAGPQGMGVQADHAYTLEARNKVQAVAFDLRGREGGAQFEGPHDTANIRAASGGSSRSYVAQAWAVRRLTPTECERLQGFPDDYTAVPHRGKPMADGPRYKALGNSMAVPVMRWLGERIALVDAMPAQAGVTL